MNWSNLIIIPTHSHLYRSLSEAARNARMVFMAGIPGVGKSLYVQQLVLMAQEAGREVHLLQYDSARLAFENHPHWRDRYPEHDGLTHPFMRKAVGIWARQAIFCWLSNFSDPRHILIGEVPLIGNRLIELVQVVDDNSEPYLASPETIFVIPVPSAEIRQKIVAKRQQTIQEPGHKKETKDAPINVLEAVWADAYRLAARLRLMAGETPTGRRLPYDPQVYAAVYEYLCRHRHTITLSIDLDLDPPGSVYDEVDQVKEVLATGEQAQRIMSDLETSFTAAAIEAMVDRWYQ